MKDIWQELNQAFQDQARNWRQIVYVYRVGRTGEAITPYLLKSRGDFESDGELLDHLRDQHDGGTFRILIRDGRTMVFSGTVSIWSPSHGRLRRGIA